MTDAPAEMATGPYEALSQAVRRRATAICWLENHPATDNAADAELADERVALAARDLVRYIEASGSQPVGWESNPVNGTPDDPSWPAHRVLTCGACGETFGSNLRPGEVACPECEARLCSSCGHWEGSTNG